MQRENQCSFKTMRADRGTFRSRVGDSWLGKHGPNPPMCYTDSTGAFLTVSTSKLLKNALKARCTTLKTPYRPAKARCTKCILQRTKPCKRCAQLMTPSPSTFHSMAFASVFFFALRFSLRRRRFSSASCSILSLFMAKRVSRSVTSRNLSSSLFRLRYRRRSRTSSTVARLTSPD